jgi:predicted MarR family transcription regulator
VSTGTDVSVLYREFTDALAEVLAENAGSPARRGRLARAHAAVKRHPDYSEHEYFLAVEAAFAHWEAMQKCWAIDNRQNGLPGRAND